MCADLNPISQAARPSRTAGQGAQLSHANENGGFKRISATAKARDSELSKSAGEGPNELRRAVPFRQHAICPKVTKKTVAAKPTNGGLLASYFSVQSQRYEAAVPHHSHRLLGMATLIEAHSHETQSRKIKNGSM
jgi:hypothetical protein